MKRNYKPLNEHGRVMLAMEEAFFHLPDTHTRSELVHILGQKKLDVSDASPKAKEWLAERGLPYGDHD